MTHLLIVLAVIITPIAVVSAAVIALIIYLSRRGY